MRFNTPEEVLAWADKVAREDIRRHVEYNIELNPFCTQGAREEWSRGYQNLGPRSYDWPRTMDFDTIYQRGRAVGRLQVEEPHLFEDKVKPGDRVITCSHGAGTVTERELANNAYPNQTPHMVGTGRWGVKLDDADKHPHYKDGIAYYMPHELSHEPPA